MAAKKSSGKKSGNQNSAIVENSPAFHKNILNIDDKYYPYIIIGGVLVLAFVIYFSFFFGDKLYAYTDIGKDNVDTYWPNYYLVADMVESGDIYGWSDRIGAGTNIYSISPMLTDPITIFNLIAGKENIIYIFIWVALVKFLLSGFLTYKYLSYLRLNKNAVLTGALLYTFSGFAVIWGQHYQFHSFVALLPLALLGAEKWIRENKFIIMVISLALLLMISIYFVFQFAFFYALYLVYRYLIYEKRTSGDVIRFLLMTGLVVGLAFGIAAVFYLPRVYTIATSPRVGEDMAVMPAILDTVNYYFQLIFRIFSANLTGVGSEFYKAFMEDYLVTRRYTNYYEFPMIYAGLLNLLLIPQLFLLTNGRERTIHLIFGLLMLMFLVFPVFSYIFNALSTIQYRWTLFATMLMVLYGAIAFHKIIEAGKLSIKGLYITLTALSVLLISSVFASDAILGLTGEQVNEMLLKSSVAIMILGIYTLALRGLTKSSMAKGSLAVLIFMIFVEILYSSYPAVNERYTMKKDFREDNVLYYDDSMDAINYIKENDPDNIYRIDKTYSSALFNDALIQEYKGLKSYLPLNTPAYIDFIRYTERSLKFGPSYIQLSSRKSEYMPFVTNYLGCKYIVTNNPNFLITGYEPYHQTGESIIHKNNYPLELIFAYDSLVTLTDTRELPFIEKEKLLLYYAAVDEEFPKDLLPIKDFGKDDYLTVQNDFDLRNIIISENAFPKSIKFRSREGNGGLEFTISNINEEITKILMNLGVDAPKGAKMKIHFRTEEQNYSELNTNVPWFNLYTGDKKYNMRFNLPAGTNKMMFEFTHGNFNLYDFFVSYNDTLEVQKKYEARAKNKFEYTLYEPDNIKGKITVDKNSMLNFSIPYEKGWELKINGQQANIHRINSGMMGAVIEPGENEIHLRYMVPMYRTGLMVSSISTIAFALVIGLAFMRNRKK
ncbi:MAG: YfhO family protein [Candidatus Kapaibacterium sp.]